MNSNEPALPTRHRLLLLLFGTLFAASLAGWGCDSDEESPQAETTDESTAEDNELPERTETIDGVEIVYEAGPEPTPDTVLARAGDIEVTLSDFDQAMERSLLIAPKKDGEVRTEVPKQRLAVPQTQLSVVRRLLAQRIIDRAAKQRGIEATVTEKKEALQSHPRLSRFADLVEERPEQTPDALKKRGLDVDEVDEIARDIVVRNKLREQLVSEIGDDELWEAYRARNNTVKLVLTWVRNTPRSATIDAYVRRQKDERNSEIEAYFEQNKRRYRRPKMLEAVLLSPPPGEEADEETLARAAKRLESEADYEKIADDLGLELDENARLVRQENQRAFGSKAGTTGYETSGPRGAYAWRVTGFTESKEAELTSGLRRQIAAELLRTESVVPTAAAKLTKMRRAMKEADTDDEGSLTETAIESLRKKAENLGLKFHVTEHFPLTPRGFIPGVGLAKDVSEAAEELTLEEPLAGRPILSREKAYVVRLQEQNTPTRESFEDAKSTFRERYLAEKRRRILDEFVAAWENENAVQLDVRPLRVKYGVAQKK